MTTSRKVSPQVGATLSLAAALLIKKVVEVDPKPAVQTPSAANENRVARTLEIQKAPPAPYSIVPELDAGARVIPGPDLALNEIAASMRLNARHSQFVRGPLRFMISMVENEADLKKLLESRVAFSKIPAICDLFLGPAAGVVYEPPLHAMRSQFRPAETPADIQRLQPLAESGRDETGRGAASESARSPSIGGYRSKRAYLISVAREGQLIYGRQPGTMSWEQMSHAQLMDLLIDAMAKLSRLHGAGYETDTSIDRIVVAPGFRFYLTPGHLKPLHPKSVGILQVCYLLHTFGHDLSPADVQELWGVYLQADPQARARAEKYLLTRHVESLRTKDLPYAPHTPLQERLARIVEDWIDPISHEFSPAAEPAPGHFYRPSAHRSWA